jgi:hypothetical protein
VVIRGIVGGFGLLLIGIGALFLGQGIGAIGGSFMSGRKEWAVAGGVSIAIGFCLLFAARYRDRSRL